jgi:altronate hydrolase
MAGDRREPCPASELVIGLKCGGSDGFSGISANPLVGRVADRLTALGGTAVLTEVPEMFGAEQILMNRARDERTFGEVVRMINDFRRSRSAPPRRAGGRP